jgi:flagellar protein FliJ
MAAFRFRASAALDLRRKQEDEAASVLAAAEARFHEGNELLAQVERQRARALAEHAEQSRRGIGAAALCWHRNWITRLQNAADDVRADVRRLAALAEEARRAWQMAKRRRMALDRLRERALARYQADERQQERKLLDELARIRFVMPDGGDGGMTDGN